MWGYREPKGGEKIGRREAPAEAAAREREGRDTPKSEGRREEDETRFGPMGREGKIFGEKMRDKRGDGLGGN